MVAGRGRSFGIVIATFGVYLWRSRGEELAENLEKISGADEVIHCHAKTLAEARNAGARKITTDWLTFVDADDTIDMDFIEEMRAAAEPKRLLQPATIGCNEDGVFDAEAVLIPQADLSQRNYLVVATTMERAGFVDVGGFRELDALEDWDLFCRLIIKGYEVKRVPTAVYQVNFHSNSRNQNVIAQNRAARQIRREYADHGFLLRTHQIH